MVRGVCFSRLGKAMTMNTNERRRKLLPTHTKNYYELLGLTPEASTEEIKSAYREIARVYHPDSQFYTEIIEDDLTDLDHNIFKEITCAYNVLINPDKRKVYDDRIPKGLRSWEAEDFLFSKPNGKIRNTTGSFGCAQVSAFRQILNDEPPSVAQILHRNNLYTLEIVLMILGALLVGAVIALAIVFLVIK